MKEQTILHLMVESSLLYVILNRSYSHLKNVPLREHCQFWVIQTEETKHIEKESLMITLQQNHVFWRIFLIAVYPSNINQQQFSFFSCDEKLYNVP